MSLQPPVVPAYLRVMQSMLTDRELAYIVDLIWQSQDKGYNPPGWSDGGCAEMDRVFQRAAIERGIKNGVRVVTQTVDLRS